jgi:hypothetical protein
MSLFDCFKRSTPTEVESEIILGETMYRDLSGVMDNLIYNNKVTKLADYNDTYEHSDEFISFYCRSSWGKSNNICINDSTDTNIGLLVSFRHQDYPVWHVKNVTCRENLINHLNSIVEMARQLPNREDAFCKRLGGKK